MGFEYTLESDDKIVVVYPKGRILDKSEGADMLQELEKKISDGNRHVIINLQGLDYMNSGGLTILINLLTKCRNQYGEMVLCEVGEKISKLLITSKLQNIFTIVETEQEAKEKLRASTK
jgi:anti-sigma B factor antagonist